MKVKGVFIPFIVLCLTLTLFVLSPILVQASPTTDIQATIDTILESLRDKALALPAKQEERRKKIETLIKERFDFEEMAKRSLARHWNKRSDEERKEFVALFSELLMGSYIRKIESYTNEKVTYNKEEIKSDNKYSEVSTTIITQKVDIPVEYKLIQKEGTWWIYDVVIEGVSFISTYRSQYNEIIMKDSFAGLIKAMQEKLDEVIQKDTQPQ